MAVRGTVKTNISDIATDLNIIQDKINHPEIEGSVHSGFLNRSLEIPIDFFLDKLIDDDYQLIFTGHSLGAAVAALLTVRVLFNDKVFGKQQLENRVLFIGFGSPTVGDKEFANCINKYFSSLKTRH